MNVPLPIKTAFEHVQSLFPEVTMVLYTPTQRWLYMDEDGNAPSFDGKVDVGLLEDGADAVEFLPCVFAFPYADAGLVAEGSQTDELTIEDVFMESVLVNLVDLRYLNSKSPEALTLAGNLWRVANISKVDSGTNILLKCPATGFTECVRKENIANFALARRALKTGDQFVNTARIFVKGRAAAVEIGHRWAILKNDGRQTLHMECTELGLTSLMDIASFACDFVRFHG